MEAVMVNVEELKAKRTNGENYDVSTEDIIARLRQWDAKNGIETTDIEFDAVTVRFARNSGDVLHNYSGNRGGRKRLPCGK
jgi:hypothetical protein